MTELSHEHKVLVALAKEYAEARRPVRWLIVLAACNAKTGAQTDRVITALLALKRQNLVSQHEDCWSVTTDGQWLAQRLSASSSPPKTASPEEPIESGFKKPTKLRETLRPIVGGAPRPVTRPADPLRDSVRIDVAPREPSETCKQSLQVPPPPAVKESLTVARRWDEPPDAWELPIEATVSLHRGHAIPRDLLERCAAMHLTLLAQARMACEAGEPGAENELRWLMETGEQLLAVGGAR